MSKPKRKRYLYSVERREPIILRWWPLPGALYDSLSAAEQRAEQHEGPTRIVRGIHPADAPGIDTPATIG